MSSLWATYVYLYITKTYSIHEDTGVNPNFLLFCILAGTVTILRYPSAPPSPKLSTGFAHSYPQGPHVVHKLYTGYTCGLVLMLAWVLHRGSVSVHVDTYMPYMHTSCQAPISLTYIDLMYYHCQLYVSIWLCNAF